MLCAVVVVQSDEGIACQVCRSVTLKIHSFQNYIEWESWGPKLLKSQQLGDVKHNIPLSGHNEH